MFARAEKVATQKGTKNVRGIFHSKFVLTGPYKITSPWLRPVRMTPTMVAVMNDFFNIGICIKAQIRHLIRVAVVASLDLSTCPSPNGSGRLHLKQAVSCCVGRSCGV